MAGDRTGPRRPDPASAWAQAHVCVRGRSPRGRRSYNGGACRRPALGPMGVAGGIGADRGGGAATGWGVVPASIAKASPVGGPPSGRWVGATSGGDRGGGAAPTGWGLQGSAKDRDLFEHGSPGFRYAPSGLHGVGARLCRAIAQRSCAPTRKHPLPCPSPASGRGGCRPRGGGGDRL